MVHAIKKGIWLLGTHEYRFVILALVWGMLFSFLIVPWQTPDEHTHLTMIVEALGNGQVDDYYYQEMNLGADRIIYNSNEKINQEQLKAALTQRPDYKNINIIPNKIALNTISHLPATIGIYIGILFRLPIYWVMQLGEMCSLMFYVALGYLTIKITPIKKGLFEIIMLIPMCIQQATSISYDSVLLPLCFLAIAYILKLKYKSEEITLKDILVFFVIIAVITVCKMPYGLFGALIFILPVNKVKIRIGKICITGKQIKKYIPIAVVAVLVGLFAAVYIFEDNVYLGILKYSIIQFDRTIYLFTNTIKNFAGYLFISLIGNFGYLDTPINSTVAVIFSFYLIFVSLITINHAQIEKRICWKDTILFWVIGIGLCYLITLSMVLHTALITKYGTVWGEMSVDASQILYQIPYIGGVQGRYYLPVVPLLLIPIPNSIRFPRRVYHILDICVIIVTMVYTCFLVYERFW